MGILVIQNKYNEDYEPVNKQVYQQYKDMRTLDAKVNPEQHKKGD